MNKLFGLGIVVAILIAAGGYFYPVFKIQLGTAAGASFVDVKQAVINMTPAAAGANATTSSILNNDSSDRVIQDGFSWCSGVGTSNAPAGNAGIKTWNLTAATTSTSVPSDISALTNFAYNTIIATATPGVYNVASTTLPVLGDISRIWKSGSYLTFFLNATNTAACTVGVHYLGT